MANLLTWVTAHSTVLASAGVAVLDLLFALNPNSNAPDGLLHMFYVTIKKFAGGSKPTP